MGIRPSMLSVVCGVAAFGMIAVGGVSLRPAMWAGAVRSPTSAPATCQFPVTSEEEFNARIARDFARLRIVVESKPALRKVRIQVVERGTEKPVASVPVCIDSTYDMVEYANRASALLKQPVPAPTTAPATIHRPDFCPIPLYVPGSENFIPARPVGVALGWPALYRGDQGATFELIPLYVPNSGEELVQVVPPSGEGVVLMPVPWAVLNSVALWLTTDTEGRIEVELYPGDYQLTVPFGTGKLTVPDAGDAGEMRVEIVGAKR